MIYCINRQAAFALAWEMKCPVARIKGRWVVKTNPMARAAKPKDHRPRKGAIKVQAGLELGGVVEQRAREKKRRDDQKRHQETVHIEQDQKRHAAGAFHK